MAPLKQELPIRAAAIPEQQEEPVDHAIFGWDEHLKPVAVTPLRSSSMVIFVRDLQGKSRRFLVEPIDTVSSLMTAIEEVGGIPAQQQRLLFGGKSLAQDKWFYECGVKDGSVLSLVLALRGS